MIKDILCKGNPSLLQIQLTLVIWKSKGLSEILRDIRTYQICRIEQKYK